MTTDNETIQHTLHGMRELLAEPSRWTQGAFARDKEGSDQAVAHPEATCFCLVGAARIVTHLDDDVTNTVVAHLAAITRQRGCSCVALYNDASTHAEVLDLLDTAIAKLEGDAA